MKIKLFKKEKSFKKKKESLWLDINFYWKLAILFMFLAIALSCVFGYYFFTQTNKEFVISSNTSSGRAEIFNKERIEKVLEYFSLREEKSTEILNSSVSAVDPSL